MSCLFCRIVAREVPATIVHEDDDVLAFRDLAPAAPVHVLVVPKAHVATFADMADAGGPASAAAVFGGVARAAAALGLSRDGGYRLVVNCGESAGQTVFHVHVHILAGRSFGWPPG